MKRRLKPFVIPTMVSIGSIMVIAGAYLGTINLPSSGPSNSFSNIDYVTDTILENNLPVINATTKDISISTADTLPVNCSKKDFLKILNTIFIHSLFNTSTYCKLTNCFLTTRNIIKNICYV